MTAPDGVSIPADLNIHVQHLTDHGLSTGVDDVDVNTKTVSMEEAA